MFLCDPEFVRSEMSCPLLKNNRGYLEKNLEKCWAQTRCWEKLILQKCFSDADSSESAVSLGAIRVDFASVRKRAGLVDDDNGDSTGLIRPIKSTLSFSSPTKSKMSSEEKIDDRKSWSDGYKLRVQSKPERILLRDAERTFLFQKQREILISMCTGLRNLYGDYQQTVSYVTGILLLFFDQKIVFKMMIILGQSPKYSLRGYWRHEALDQAIDANVVYLLLKNQNNRLYNHLFNQCHILPQTFLQKYLGCLGGQVLPIKTVLSMWTGFFQFGLRYLFNFILTLLNHLNDALTKTKSSNELYEILGLDRRSKFYLNERRWKVSIDKCPLSSTAKPLGSGSLKSAEDRAVHQWCDEYCYQTFFDEVMQLTNQNWNSNKYGLQEIDIFRLRIEAYHESGLMKSMESAAMAINFDSMCISRCDKDENADSSNDDNEDCQLCEDGFADLYCKVCEIYICEICHKNQEGEHLKTHEVVWMETDVD